MTTIAVKPSTAENRVQVNTDLVDGVHTPIYKQGFGVDGVAPVSVSETNPMPTVTTGKNPQGANANTRTQGTAFVTTAVVAAGATFSSGVLNNAGYSQAQTEILSDKDGTISISFCADAAGTDVVRSLAIPYVAANGYQFFAAPAFADYIKYEFTNTEGTDTTDFYYTTKFVTTAISPQLLTTSAFISPAMVATLNRSVLVGQTRGGGDFINVPVDSRGQLEMSQPISAFGDLRTAELSPILQITFEATTTNTEIGTITTAGSGAVTNPSSKVLVATGATTASSASWRTVKTAKYRAGMGGVMRFTGMFTTGVAGTEQMVGLADIPGSTALFENGYAVGYDGTQFSFLRYSNDVLYPIPQTQWDDPCDGTGKSGMILDPTKLNVYFIQFQYLGAGAITLWIESDVTGDMFVAHTVQYTNRNTVPSVLNPNFRMKIAADNRATTAELEVSSSSMAFFIEGQSTYIELQQPTFSSGRRAKTSVTTEVALFTIRNKTTYNSKLNYVDIILQNIQSAIEAGAANNLGQVRVIKNATLGGVPAWVDVNTASSVVEIDTAGTTVTGGIELIYVPLAGKNAFAIVDMTPYEIFLTPGDSITVAGLSAASATIDAGALWKELF